MNIYSRGPAASTTESTVDRRIRKMVAIVLKRQVMVRKVFTLLTMVILLSFVSLADGIVDVISLEWQ